VDVGIFSVSLSFAALTVYNNGEAKKNRELFLRVLYY
jgi:hypothetical protein